MRRGGQPASRVGRVIGRGGWGWKKLRRRGKLGDKDLGKVRDKRGCLDQLELDRSIAASSWPGGLRS